MRKELGEILGQSQQALHSWNISRVRHVNDSLHVREMRKELGEILGQSQQALHSWNISRVRHVNDSLHLSGVDIFDRFSLSPSDVATCPMNRTSSCLSLNLSTFSLTPRSSHRCRNEWSRLSLSTFAFVIASPYSNAYLTDHCQARTSKCNYRRLTLDDVIHLHVFGCSFV